MESFTPPPNADALPAVTGVAAARFLGGRFHGHAVGALFEWAVARMGRLLRMSDNCAAAREAFQ